MTKYSIIHNRAFTCGQLHICHSKSQKPKRSSNLHRAEKDLAEIVVCYILSCTIKYIPFFCLLWPSCTSVLSFQMLGLVQVCRGSSELYQSQQNWKGNDGPYLFLRLNNTIGRASLTIVEHLLLPVNSATPNTVTPKEATILWCG